MRGGRKPPGDVAPHPVPRQMVPLTAATQARATTADRPPARNALSARAVHGHAVVADVPSDDRAQIRALLRDGLVHAPPQFGLHRLAASPATACASSAAAP